MKSWMIGFVAGVVLVSQWPALPPWPVLTLPVAAAVYAFRGRSWRAHAACGLASAAALAIAFGHIHLQQRVVDDCVGTRLLVSGVVSSLPGTSRMFDGGLRQRFEFAVADLSPARCSGPSRLMLSYYGDERIIPGERWQFEVALKKPWGLANPGSFNLQSWFAQKGIDAVGSVRDADRALRLEAAGMLRVPHHRLRLKISERIAALHMSPPVLAILQALTVGDKNGLDAQLWQLLQQYGINHLLVISGLHIGLVAGLGYLLGGGVLRLCPVVGPTAAAIPLLTGLLLAFCYAALAGFTLPTQRALCMLGAFVFASLAKRSSHPANTILLAATVVLALNPLAALGSGFWLSFGAVSGLLWLANWQRGLGLAGKTLGTHGFMALAMLPLGAFFFGGGSLVSLVANMLMIPLVGFVIVPLALLAAVSSLCGWSADTTLWHFAGWPLQQLLPPARALANGADGWLYHRMTAGLGEALLGLLAVVLLVLPLRPTLKVLAGLLFLPLWLPALAGSGQTDESTRVTVLDVGQGTAVLVSSGRKALLYDTGGGDPDGSNLARIVVLPYLQEMGLRALDTLVISHPDLDHSAGASAIINAIAVQRLRYGGSGPAGVTGRPCVAGEAWRWPGGQVFQFLSPAVETLASSNNSSCVLQLDVAGYRFLLAGDIETSRERTLAEYWGDQLLSDWLLAAHHGSKTSSSLTLLKRVRPRTVVISSGYANRFGHPHPRILQRLEGTGAFVAGTASGGALTFEIGPDGALRVRQFRNTVKRFWM